jgi:hypothetical protein
MTKNHEAKDSEGAVPDLREQVEQTRTQLGDTVQELTAKADVKAKVHEKAAHVTDQVQHKATEVRDQVQHTATEVRDQVQHTASRAAHAVQERTPQPVRTAASHAAESSRSHPGPLLAAGVTMLLAVLVMRRRHNGRH